MRAPETRPYGKINKCSLTLGTSLGQKHHGSKQKTVQSTVQHSLATRHPHRATKTR